MDNTNKRINPDLEEIQNLANKELASSVKKVDSSDKPYTPLYTPLSDTPRDESNIPMKPKLSIFEPTPVKYRLITGSHQIPKHFLTENNEIFVRKISTIEEAMMEKLKSGNEKDIERAMTEIINSCIKTNISVHDLPLIEKVPLFLFIIAISYGSIVNMSPIEGCNVCDNTTKCEIDYINDLEVNYYNEKVVIPTIHRLSSFIGANIEVSVQPPLIKGEEVLTTPVTDNNTLLMKLKQLVANIQGTKPDGTEVTKADWNDILTFLSEEDKTAIKNIVDNYTDNYGVNFEVNIKNCSKENCPKVGQKEKFSVQDFLFAFLFRGSKFEGTK